jgi:hypothetical protein
VQLEEALAASSVADAGRDVLDRGRDEAEAGGRRSLA